jgi:hypothetical protein
VRSRLRAFVVERGRVFPQDFELHYEGSTGVCEDGALEFTLSEYSEEQPLVTRPVRSH